MGTDINNAPVLVLRSDLILRGETLGSIFGAEEVVQISILPVKMMLYESVHYFHNFSISYSSSGKLVYRMFEVLTG